MNDHDGTQSITFFKYLPFNEGSLNVLREGTWKYTHPARFNDPFDCSPVLDPLSAASFVRKRPEIFAAAAKHKGYSPAKRIEHKQRMLKKLEQAVASGEFNRGLVEGIGVCCFTLNPTNLLMWSHYAQQHQGFVVEFRLDLTTTPAPIAFHHFPMPVVYSVDRPILQLGDESAEAECYRTKSVDWSYEEELRSLRQVGDGTIQPYSREHLLVSVVAGCRMDPSDGKALIEAARKASLDIGRDVPVYDAQLSQTKYKVLIPKHPNPLFSED
ncbi:DUF2971 domain-containing protein [Pseudomonas profundi]|uniref:DUF2971 domain-containing protein n=1 Tax=Pseudomonas profundi TaxID=1981513 RepID=UPI0016804912|nr:DUF2971 domain-containing protein [Pseudomonas profundi]